MSSGILFIDGRLLSVDSPAVNGYLLVVQGLVTIAHTVASQGKILGINRNRGN